ncbi:MAG: M48 family metallopeptidase [Gammaproteobacteria bacterium]
MSAAGRRHAHAVRGAALALAALLSLAARAEIALHACDAEVQRARATLSTIFSQWPLRPTGDPVDKALQAITNQLALQAGEQDHRQWRTHVLRDSKLNAFSIGDGHIFVTEGMLRFVDSEAELAALLTHEFAHHVAGHFCQKPRKARFVRHLFGVGDEQGGQVGELSASMDPDKERDADRIGTVMLRRGGYNPRVAVLLAARMSATGTPAHFQYGQRIEALQKLLADEPRAGWNAGDSAAFTQMKDALRAEPAAR